MCPHLPPYAHRHQCVGCDNWIACHQPHDQCAVPDPYVCPNCEQAQLDAHVEQESQLQPAPAQEGF